MSKSWQEEMGLTDAGAPPSTTPLADGLLLRFYAARTPEQVRDVAVEAINLFDVAERALTAAGITITAPPGPVSDPRAALTGKDGAD